MTNNKFNSWTKSLIAVATVFFLDYMFHDFFTDVMETDAHFMIISALAFLMSYLYFENKTSRINVVMSYGLIIGLFHFIGGTTSFAYLSNFPDITFFGTTLNLSSHPISSTVIYGYIHAKILFAGLYLSKEITK